MGRSAIDRKFLPFVEWFHETYDAELLHIVKDKNADGTSRLQLIFEHQKDAEKLLLKNRLSHSSRKEKAIIKKYLELYPDSGEIPIQLLFYAFELLARQEAVASVPLKVKEDFKERHKEILWEVAIFGEYVTFFYYTNDGLNAALKQKHNELIRNEYFDLIKPFDQFNYFTRENFNVIFDSKQNFDERYESNWRYYYA